MEGLCNEVGDYLNCSSFLLMPVSHCSVLAVSDWLAFAFFFYLDLVHQNTFRYLRSPSAGVLELLAPSGCMSELLTPEGEVLNVTPCFL
jgi:hypothetical protein